MQPASESDSERALEIARQHREPDETARVGAVDPIDARIETLRTVRDRSLQAARSVPRDRLGIADDCGFAPFGDDTSTAGETALAKISAHSGHAWPNGGWASFGPAPLSDRDGVAGARVLRAVTQGPRPAATQSKRCTAHGSAMKTIEYFYSTRSIYAYFGAERAVALARRFGRRLVHHPVDLSRVVPAAGSLPFDQRSAAHKAYQFGREIERWSEYLGIPALVDPKHHFGGRGFSAGVILAAQAAGADVDRLHVDMLRALWQFDRDLDSAQVLAELVRAAGADPATLLEAALSQPMQAAFEACTERAIALGVPGSPTYIVDGEMFYGQDRLMMVQRALEKPFAPPGPAPRW